MSELNNETYYGGISMRSRVFNKLDIKATKEAIEVVQAQFEKDMKNPRKTHLKSEKIDVPYAKLKKEPIEYVIEESKEQTEEER